MDLNDEYNLYKSRGIRKYSRSTIKNFRDSPTSFYQNHRKYNKIAKKYTHHQRRQTIKRIVKICTQDGSGLIFVPTFIYNSKYASRTKCPKRDKQRKNNGWRITHVYKVISYNKQYKFPRHIPYVPVVVPVVVPFDVVITNLVLRKTERKNIE